MFDDIISKRFDTIMGHVTDKQTDRRVDSVSKLVRNLKHTMDAVIVTI